MAAERALAIFKEDLGGSIEVAKAAAQRMSVIAVVMGKAATKAQLLPFLLEKVRDPETPDEILYRLAEQLDMAPLLGGFDPLLVAPLELLCATEETLVRDSAAKSVNSLVAQCTPAQVQQHWAPMLLRLCAEASWFTSRVSAAKVCASICAACEGAATAGGEEQAQLLQLRELLVTKLCQDESPMVKRAAAAALGSLARLTSAQHRPAVLQELRPALKQLLLAQPPGGGPSEADAVRVEAVGSLAALALLGCESADAVAQVHELCASLAKDSSWKLRVALASELGAVAKAAQSKGQSADFVSVFELLQHDPEPEVRFVAACNCVSMAEACSAAEVGAAIVPNLLALVGDPGYRTAQERAQLSALLVSLVSRVEPTSEAAGRIVAEVGAMLSNSEESQLVRIQLVESSPLLVAAVGHASAAGRELLAKLLRFFELPQGSAAEAASRAAAAAAAAGGSDAPIAGSNPRWCWRLRFVAVEVVGSEAFLQLGLDLYREHLAPIVRAALVDSCALVRVCALTQMAKWAATFAGQGAAHGQWADENLVSVLAQLRSSGDKGLAKAYGHRLTTIYGLEVSAGFLSADGLATLAAIVAEKDASAETPNVRLAAARCFGRLAQSLDFQGSAAENIVTSTLQKLASDPDPDAKALAAAALANEQLPLTFTHWGPTGAPWILAK